MKQLVRLFKHPIIFQISTENVTKYTKVGMCDLHALRVKIIIF